MSLRFLLAASLFFAAADATAANLYAGGGWPAMASDRIALQAGDSLTVLVYENSSASNSARNNSGRNSRIDGSIRAGSHLDETAGLGLSGNFANNAQTDRSGRMVAQLSVVVDEVLPGGDLHVSGGQVLRINGERTDIRVRGRVRRADIMANNTILSTRLADAEIAYDGHGFVSRGSRPGLASRIFNFLGL